MTHTGPGLDAFTRGRPAAGSRATPLGARGEPMVWLTGLSLSVCVAMILGLLSLVVVHGSTAFIVRPIERVTLASGETFLGMPMRDETYPPGAEEAEVIRSKRESEALPAGALSADGLPIRRLFRVGNREVLGQPFRWVPLHEIATAKREPSSVLLERRAWGVWVGEPSAVITQDTVTRPGPRESVIASETVRTPGGEQRVERTVISENADGTLTVRERNVVAEGAEASMKAYRRLAPEAAARIAEIDGLKAGAVGSVNARLERERLTLREAELRAERAASASSPALTGVAFGALVAASFVLLALAFRRTRRALMARIGERQSPSRHVLSGALWLLGFGGLLFASVESPWSDPVITPERLAQVREAHDARVAALNAEYEEILGQIRAIEREDSRHRFVVVDSTGQRFSPLRQTEPDEPMLISQVVRAVQPNGMSFPGKAAVYLDRWREFLFDEPREANTEGGIFPVIFGTVVLTILLSVAVVPLGVVAALYLREYARQGTMTSIVRIAVNNLAGVPSIVYGVFGLGFFCYSVGQFIDAGPSQPVSRGAWWITGGGLAAMSLLAVWLGFSARPVPGTRASALQRRMALGAGLLWAGCAALAVFMVVGTPYFDGFFRPKLPSPTFGSKGLLWASLTLALLTLPVVIVATEEAIAAVPRSMREGSYGCGASKWQTIHRIVLPRAMPGIMTGMILAMARGAGEVAPLMLVGAVKLAPELIVTREFPFLHLDRSFMHLGFHIYDVGFQSPDSEAARPLVWCTTLVLIVLVLMLTTTAIRIRAGFRKKFIGEAF